MFELVLLLPSLPLNTLSYSNTLTPPRYLKRGLGDMTGGWDYGCISHDPVPHDPCHDYSLCHKGLPETGRSSSFSPERKLHGKSQSPCVFDAGPQKKCHAMPPKNCCEKQRETVRHDSWARLHSMHCCVGFCPGVALKRTGAIKGRTGWSCWSLGQSAC